MAIHEDGSSRKRKNGDDNNNNNGSSKCCKLRSRKEIVAAAAGVTTTDHVQEKKKIQKLSSSSSVPTSSQISKAMKLMGPSREGDTIIGSIAEIKLDNQIFWWDDGKYNRRKPKYFNRVHIGYEWNRYNRDLYNKTDQKPPKVVQGYKFNLFYPELISKSRSPMYSIMQDGSRDGETCVIRFSAGPPYEDIAFRIVNRELERYNKRGFKCSFEQGFFQLYFNFKRFPTYRRYYG